MKIVITASELMDRYLWEKACDLLGWSPWAVNEGLMDSDEEVTLSAEVANRLGLLAPGIYVLPQDTRVVIHKDGDLTNNDISNIEIRKQEK